MITYQNITLRRFTVEIRDNRSGETRQDTIVLSKQQLQAAQIVGQSSRELIERLYNRKGYAVLEIIGRPEKREVTLDLEELAGNKRTQSSMEEISRDALEFLLECAQDLASCLEQDAEDHFDTSSCATGEFIRDDIRISGNLLNRADDLRNYVKKLAGRYSVVMDDGQQ